MWFLVMQMSPSFPKLVLCALVMLAAAAQAQAPRGFEFELPADSRVPFLVMRTTPGELAGGQMRVLRVFRDGHCQLERPPIMRSAGTHEWRLSPGEVAALVQQMLDADVAELDVPTMRASLRGSDDAGATYRLDDDIVEFDLRLDRFRGRGGAVQRGLERRLRLVGLRGLRARHPGDVRVRRLAELRDTLDSMAKLRAPVAEPTP